ncbi:MAG: TIGR02391 family protein [Chloroflexota bacterium]
MELEVVFRNSRHLQSDIEKLRLGVSSVTKPAYAKLTTAQELYDTLVTDKELRKATNNLFKDGYYARAVEEAYKCLNNIIKTKSGCASDGSDLMNQVFSEKNPMLKLNNLKTKSEKDEQVGYMQIFGGCMTGIRNPRAHEHQKVDSPEVALELLVWANHLMRTVDNAKRTKRHRKQSPASTP